MIFLLLNRLREFLNTRYTAPNESDDVVNAVDVGVDLEEDRRTIEDLRRSNNEMEKNLLQLEFHRAFINHGQRSSN